MGEWTCALCAWTCECTLAIGSVRRVKRCAWSTSTLRNMRTCIWCYDRMGFATHEEFRR